MTGREDSEREGNVRSRRCVGRERREEHGSGEKRRETRRLTKKWFCFFILACGTAKVRSFLAVFS